MKRIIIFFTFFLNVYTLSAQTNSVTLKNGSGTVLGQYISIQSAYNAIPSTISHPYVIEINNIYTGSDETYPITFTSRTGTSTTNTITLRPSAGSSGMSISGNSLAAPIMILDGIDYMTIDGRPVGSGADTADLKIENTATTNIEAGVINIRSAATNNNIQYINSIAHSDTASFNMCIGGIPPTTANHNNKIFKCNIKGAETGIYLRGFDGVLTNNCLVSECRVFDFERNGIKQLGSLDNTTIEKCEIFHTGPISTSLVVRGIEIGTRAGGTNYYRKNKIYNLQSSSSSPSLIIYGLLLGSDVAFLSNIQISNNFISLPKNNNNVTSTIGIDLNATEISNMFVYYNSIYIGGTQSSGTGITSACIRNNARNNVDLTVRNNLFYMGRLGPGAPTAGWYPVVNMFSEVNRNDYYNTSPGGSNAVWLTTPYTNLSSYRAAATPNESQSRFELIEFVSDIDLHLTGSSLGNPLLKGLPISGITDDIDGNPRSSSPYMGADEVVPSNIINISQSPGTYNLSQNYPNPFNPSTIINFSIPEKEFVTLKVYDIMGREVKILLNEELNSGTYKYQFTASGLSSGVYYYTITAGDFRQTKPMILIK